MSADDWQGCPVCEEKVKKYKEYAYGKVPKNIYEQVESKAKHITSWNSDDWSPDNCVNDYDYDGKDKLIEEIIDWVECSIETGTPVRIDYNYSLNKNGTYSFDFDAYCNNCSTGFIEEKEK